MKRRLKIYFDGGCRPNPGPIEVAVVAQGEAHFHDDLGSGSNTEAEWYALIKAAQLACQMGAGPVELIGDSLGVIAQANGKAKCRGDRAIELRAAYLQLAAAIPELRLRWSARSQNLAGIALEGRRQFPVAEKALAKRTND
ncbi:MAG: reverse transcriptase-like protein [Novosphingobium sp.]